MSLGGNELLAGLVVFVLASVAAVHAWDKYWDARARARESILRHECVDGTSDGVGDMEREGAAGGRAGADNGRFNQALAAGAVPD